MKLFNAVLLAGAAQAGVGSRVIDMVRSNRSEFRRQIRVEPHHSVIFGLWSNKNAAILNAAILNAAMWFFALLFRIKSCTMDVVQTQIIFYDSYGLIHTVLVIQYVSYSMGHTVSVKLILVTRTSKDWPRSGSPGKISLAKFTNPWKKRLKGMANFRYTRRYFFKIFFKIFCKIFFSEWKPGWQICCTLKNTISNMLWAEKLIHLAWIIMVIWPPMNLQKLTMDFWTVKRNSCHPIFPKNGFSRENMNFWQKSANIAVLFSNPRV